MLRVMVLSLRETSQNEIVFNQEPMLTQSEYYSFVPTAMQHCFTDKCIFTQNQKLNSSQKIEFLMF